MKTFFFLFGDHIIFRTKLLHFLRLVWTSQNRKSVTFELAPGPLLVPGGTVYAQELHHFCLRSSSQIILQRCCNYIFIVGKRTLNLSLERTVRAYIEVKNLLLRSKERSIVWFSIDYVITKNSNYRILFKKVPRYRYSGTIFEKIPSVLVPKKYRGTFVLGTVHLWKTDSEFPKTFYVRYLFCIC